jgi:hypothetical protein
MSWAAGKPNMSPAYAAAHPWEDWHALRLVLNSLNRSMGLADPYPFVISPVIAGKVSFIHEWVKSHP